MSLSRQYAAISVPPRKNKKRKQPPQTEFAVNAPKKSRAQTGMQIPRGFVTPLAADAKYIDSPAGNITHTMSTAGTVQHLDIVAQGDTVNQRNGKSWINTNIQIRGRIFAGTTATLNHIAIYLIWDRQPNKVLASIDDILENRATTESESFMKRENKGRFITIKKWNRGLVGNSTTPSTGREFVVIDKWIKLPDECIAQATAADTTGVIGNRVTGALLLATIGDKVSGTTAASIVYNYRLGFKDPQ